MEQERAARAELERVERERQEKERLEKERLEEEARKAREQKEREELERLEQERAESFLVSGKLKSIQNRRAKAREKLDALLNQQAQLDVEKKEQNAQLETIAAQRAELESQQAAAIEGDDFDKAEEISNQLDELRRSTSAIYMKLIEISKKWVALEAEKPNYFDDIIKFEESIIVESESLKEEQELKVEELKKVLKEEKENVELKLGNEERRIEKRISNVESELANVTERSAKVQLQIEEQTVEQRAAKDEWLEKKSGVAREIEALLAQVEAKRREEAQIDQKLVSIEGDINVVKAKFSKELANIQAETDTISAEKAEFLAQKENVEKQQAEAQRKFELQDSLIEKEESTLKDLIESKERCVRIKREFDAQKVEIKEKSAAKKLSLETMFKLRLEIDNLWLEKDELQQEITNISSQEMALDREIRNLNTAITELADTTISGLNKKKAQALAAKNFKLVKSLKDEIELVEGQITEKKQQLETKKANVQQTSELSTVIEEKLQVILEKVKELELQWEQTGVENL